MIPHLNLSATKASMLVGAWIAAQAMWLGMGYKLEFLGESVHLQIWAAGLVLFGTSCWILGEVMDNYRPQTESKPKGKTL